jgi:hypothetical protein
MLDQVVGLLVNATHKSHSPKHKCTWNPVKKKMHCPSQSNSLCGLSESERTGLFVVARCFAGSTALEGVLMSSPQLSTTCSAKQWQCEPQRTKDFSYTGPPRKRIGALAQYYQMERKVFLLNKVLPCNNIDRATNSLAADINFLRQRSDPLPGPFTAAGIAALNPVVVIMWSPPCVLNHLSSHAHKAGTNGRAFQKISSEFYVAMASFHRKQVLLRGNSTSAPAAIVVNYADLLWQRSRVLARVLEAVPCLGNNLNPNYIPRVGVDVHPENKFKPRGSLATYAKNHDPVDCCGYNVSKGTCMNEIENPSLLSPDESLAVSDALAYLYEQSFLSSAAPLNVSQNKTFLEPEVISKSHESFLNSTT